MTIVDAVTGELCAWTIFEKPLDAPDMFVARMFVLDKPTNAVFIGSTLDEVREILHRCYTGLTRMARDPNDHPTVVETWL